MKPEHRELTAKAISIIVVVFGVASLLLFFYQSIQNFFRFEEIDFSSYVRASGWFFDGENPYQDVIRRFIYPQFLLIVVYPLTFLQKNQWLSGISIGLWSAGLYASFFATLGAAWKYLYGYHSWREALGKNLLPVGLVILMLHPFLQSEFLNGQVNLFVLGATAGFFFMLVRGKTLGAALMLAIAVSIKISPAVCLLYILFSRQFRVAGYFLILIVLFNMVIPYLINTESLNYYAYVVDEILPKVTGSDFHHGFRQFSILSTISYLFKIHWNPLVKVAVLCILAIGLVLPIATNAPRRYRVTSPFHKFAIFGALVAIVPLIFPMSEPHHLLLQTIPFLVILAYWKRVIDGGRRFRRDGLSLLFLISVLGYHVGHGLKDTPIHIFSLLGVYIGMLWLLRYLAGESRESIENNIKSSLVCDSPPHRPPANPWKKPPGD